MPWRMGPTFRRYSRYASCGRWRLCMSPCILSGGFPKLPCRVVPSIYFHLWLNVQTKIHDSRLSSKFWFTMHFGIPIFYIHTFNERLTIGTVNPELRSLLLISLATWTRVINLPASWQGLTSTVARSAVKKVKLMSRVYMQTSQLVDQMTVLKTFRVRAYVTSG